MTRAKKYGISLESYESTASGVMEKVGDGFEITKITVKLRIKADAEKDKMDAMIKEIRGRVPVVKSMKTEVTLEAEIL
jgi:organic hydroperoxide reductase OsmC/OhrA